MSQIPLCYICVMCVYVGICAHTCVLVCVHLRVHAHVCVCVYKHVHRCVKGIHVPICMHVEARGHCVSCSVMV